MTNDTDNQTGHPIIWSIGAFLLFALIGVAGHQYRQTLQESIIATAPLTSCLLNSGPCTSTLPQGGSASFNINPKPIVAVSPLQLSLQLKGINALSVEVHFQSESMDMGLSQYRLFKKSDNHFSGEGTLPVCITSSMIWIADVQVITSKGKFSFPFRFESFHPSAAQ